MFFLARAYQPWQKRRTSPSVGGSPCGPEGGSLRSPMVRPSGARRASAIAAAPRSGRVAIERPPEPVSD